MSTPPPPSFTTPIVASLINKGHTQTLHAVLYCNRGTGTSETVKTNFIWHVLLLVKTAPTTILRLVSRALQNAPFVETTPWSISRDQSTPPTGTHASPFRITGLDQRSTTAFTLRHEPQFSLHTKRVSSRVTTRIFTAQGCIAMVGSPNSTPPKWVNFGTIVILHPISECCRVRSQYSPVPEFWVVT